MKAFTNYKIYYTLRNPNKNGGYSIFISLNIEGIVKEKFSSIKTSKEYFDTKTGVISNDEKNTFLLQQMKENIEKICFQYLKTGEKFTHEDIFAILEGKGSKTFIELYTEYVLSKQALAGKTIDKITAQRYKTRLEEIKIFLVDVYKTSDMPISKPNIEFCQKYKNWLYQIRNNGEETVRKKIDVLIKVFDEAIKRDLITKNPAKFIEKERKKYDVPSKLTSEEITRLENLTFNKFNKRLESTRDCLLLSIYTGFGYAELKEFHLSEIHLYESQEVLVKIRGKSSKLSKNVKHIIALYTPQIKAIIDKYNGMSNIPKIVKSYKSLKSDFEYIKELAELDKKLHLHLGRKTRANILVNGLKLSRAEACSFLGNTEKVFNEHYAIVENSTLFSKLVSVQSKK